MAPGILPFSISRLSVSPILPRRSTAKPACSGLTVCSPCADTGAVARTTINQTRSVTLIGPSVAAGTIAPHGGVHKRRTECTSWPHRGRIHRHPARTPHQIELDIDQLRRAVLVRRGADAEQTATEPTLQRAEALPLETVERIAGRMPLRDDAAGELPPPVRIVTLTAREIELALAPLVDRAPGLEERLHAIVDRDRDRQPA